MEDTTEITAAVKPTPKRQPKADRPNTCAPSSRTKRLTRQLAGIMAHLEKHPHDHLSIARVATIKSLLAGH